jgi:putative serine/threonine protein kinase
MIYKTKRTKINIMIPKKYQKYKPEYLTKGRRGLVYIFKKANKEYIIKVKNPDSQALGKIKNEGDFTKILNKKDIGPKLLEYNEDYLVREYTKGKEIRNYQGDLKPILKQILKQCYEMDKLKINKFEMTNPYKHIIVYRNKGTLIDFERCHYTDKPKNVSQFTQYIGKHYKKIPIKLVKDYKKNPNDKNFKKLLLQL